MLHDVIGNNRRLVDYYGLNAYTVLLLCVSVNVQVNSLLINVDIRRFIMVSCLCGYAYATDVLYCLRYSAAGSS